MPNPRCFRCASFVLGLMLAMHPAAVVYAQQSSTQTTTQNDTAALERGYRTGYSDGYLAGHSDVAKGAARDAQNKEEYARADRAYQSSYGRLEDYRDGYQQGFENGYAAGYERRGFDSSTPANLARRSSRAVASTDDTAVANSNDPVSSSRQAPTTSDSSAPEQTTSRSNTSTQNTSVVLIPADTVMLVELMTNITTDASQRGDRIQAQVLEPQQYRDAVLDGRITRLRRPGRARGASEVEISFEQIRLVDNRVANINAQVIEVVRPNGTGAGDVDTEGGVRGETSRKEEIAKVGAGAGIGAAIGAIIGGGKGAAIGAVLGGAAGTADVITSRVKDIRLMRGQQLRVRTSTNTRIQ